VTVGSWRQQALIDSPVQQVWEMVGDPNRYPDWVGEEIAGVTGLPTPEPGAAFQQLTHDPSGTHVVNFQIEELDQDVRAIHLRCLDSRTYLRCALTEARGATFVDMETGIDEGDPDAYRDELTRDFFIRLAQTMLDALDGACAEESRPS